MARMDADAADEGGVDVENDECDDDGSSATTSSRTRTMWDSSGGKGDDDADAGGDRRRIDLVAASPVLAVVATMT